MIIIDNKFITTGKKITIFLLIFFSSFLFSKETLIFGITDSLYKSDINVYKIWKNYLEDKLKDQSVEVVYSKTYAQMGALLGVGSIDIATLGSPVFIKLQEQNMARILAVPIGYDNTNLMYSLIIAKKATEFHSLLDFKNKTFAFTDPNSKAGSIVPIYALAKKGIDAKKFFRKIIYTGEHEESIRAVLSGFVDGASVNSTIFDHFSVSYPTEAQKLKVIQKIGPFMISPIVSKQALNPQLYLKLQRILVRMYEDDKGREILKKLHIIAFRAPNQNDDFANLREMQTFLEKNQ